MEIRLTVNGTRKLPLDIPDETVALMRDENSEFAITLIASPTIEETAIGGDGEPHFKVKVLHISEIRTNV